MSMQTFGLLSLILMAWRILSIPMCTTRTFRLTRKFSNPGSKLQNDILLCQQPMVSKPCSGTIWKKWRNYCVIIKSLTHSLIWQTLPDIKVSCRPIEGLKAPNEEQECLSFDSFPQYMEKLFFWGRYDCLVMIRSFMEMCISTNDISNSFSPSAFIMSVPPNNPSIKKTHSHHLQGWISMGYTAATTVIKCDDVQI